MRNQIVIRIKRIVNSGGGIISLEELEEDLKTKRRSMYEYVSEEGSLENFISQHVDGCSVKDGHVSIAAEDTTQAGNKMISKMSL